MGDHCFIKLYYLSLPASGFLSEQEYLYLWEISETYEYFVGRR